MKFNLDEMMESARTYENRDAIEDLSARLMVLITEEVSKEGSRITVLDVIDAINLLQGCIIEQARFKAGKLGVAKAHNTKQ